MFRVNHLERLKLLQYVADDSRGRRLVRVCHGAPPRLGAKRLAQAADATPRAKVHLPRDRSCLTPTPQNMRAYDGLSQATNTSYSYYWVISVVINNKLQVKRVR